MPPTSDGTGATRRIADFTAGLDLADVPPEVVDHARHLLLDTIGCAIAGRVSEAGRVSLAWAAAEPGAAQSAIIGERLRVSAPIAACVNARMASALSADETFPAEHQTSHHGSPTVSAALAMGERAAATGDDLLAAILAGYEVGARMAMALVPGADLSTHGGGLRPGGYGPSSVMGAALAASRVAGLAAPEVAHTIGISGMHIDTSALKWFEVQRAPMVKSSDGGWHALTGVTAASMAAHGFTGYDTILDGPTGLWRALGYLGCDFDLLLDGLGTRWYSVNAAFKQWPCQHWMHQALTALHGLVVEHSIEPDAIERIVLRSNYRSSAPRFLAPDPPGEIERAYNMPHAAAMIALGVPPGPGWIDEAMATLPAVKRLRHLVTVEVDPETESYRDWIVDHQIREMPGSAAVVAGGRRYERQVRFGLGDPWTDATRLSEARLIEKFRSMNAGVGRDGADPDDIVTAALSVEGRTVRQFAAILGPGGPD